MITVTCVEIKHLTLIGALRVNLEAEFLYKSKRMKKHVRVQLTPVSLSKKQDVLHTLDSFSDLGICG